MSAETWVERGGGAAVAAPRAHDELGGQAPPPPTPEQIAERRFPDQCTRHQAERNAGDQFEPCGWCKAAAVQWPRVQQQVREKRLASEIADQRAQAQRSAEAISNCDMCDDKGLLPSYHLCRHDPYASERSRKGLALALAALRDESRPADTGDALAAVSDDS